MCNASSKSATAEHDDVSAKLDTAPYHALTLGD